uniref:Uncharacterized protein n=1 Tax=Magallana gigas TaxID=29159 RepID=A0A8W8IRD4_MAGGI
MDLSQYPISETSDKSDHGGLSPAARLESELSQYPISSEVSPSSQDLGRNYRTSPQDRSGEPNQASLASTSESTSSYMDLKMDNSLLGTREFDFIGHSRVPVVADSSQGDSMSQEANSYNISGKVDYASTPNQRSEPLSAKRLSQISQYTTSPEETEIQAGSARFPQSEGQFRALSLKHSKSWPHTSVISLNRESVICCMKRSLNLFIVQGWMCDEERYLMQQESNRRADSRYKQALEKQRGNRCSRVRAEVPHHSQANSFRNREGRAKNIASLPPPPKDPVLELQQPERKPVKMTDIDNSLPPTITSKKSTQ